MTSKSAILNETCLVLLLGSTRKLKYVETYREEMNGAIIKKGQFIDTHTPSLIVPEDLFPLLSQ